MADSWNLELFFDGACPLCVKEVRLIQRLDRKDRILFTDIAEYDFDAESYGRSFADFMAEIHARRPDGEWLIGADVFREIYSEVGFGFLVWPTRLPLVSNLVDFIYDKFAANRLRFTGRCNTDTRTCVEASPGEHQYQAQPAE